MRFRSSETGVPKKRLVSETPQASHVKLGSALSLLHLRICYVEDVRFRIRMCDVWCDDLKG